MVLAEAVLVPKIVSPVSYNPLLLASRYTATLPTPGDAFSGIVPVRVNLMLVTDMLVSAALIRA
ncbi:MAG: hypothetical protein BWY06_02839 [Candidatus Latescibacteria bacterium ADurb.Bin168]|nr:MAG: hypothetical protein BWY06_02839 [Candidatus Latescibacteria bacterium ADurb.Bin168]